MDDVDEFFGRDRARIGWRLIFRQHVLADVILDDFRDESVECTAARRSLPQHAAALLVGVDRALERLDLTAQPTQPVKQLPLFVRDVTHEWLP